MKKGEIKENQLVIHKELGVYGLVTIINVRKSDRGDKNELEYDLIDGKKHYDICEHSGMTSAFIEVLSKEYDLDIKIAKLNKRKLDLNIAKNLLDKIVVEQ